MSVPASQDKKLTGWHVLAMFVGGFGVIIAVNLTLAVNAVRTFPGLETDSSYIASQHFQADRAAQEALGWDVGARAENGRLVLSILDRDGAPVRAEIIEATLGRATNVSQDSHPVFAFNGTAHVADVDLAPGNWNLRLSAIAPDGTAFRQRVIVDTKR